jgi:ribonuclease-3
MKINYEFKNKNLLDLALTHISYANDTKTESNQRLEFLGDSVLSYIIATAIYKMYPGYDEGKLTKHRADLVCEKSLASLARNMELGSNIKFGRSEQMSGGQDKDSVLADTFEAVLGAIFLDAGIETATEWTLNIFDEKIANMQNDTDINYKSELQIYFQKRDKGNDVVKYVLKSKKGPDHDPVFCVDAVYNNKVIGTGTGKNRKIAEQYAAKQAFEGIKR